MNQLNPKVFWLALGILTIWMAGLTWKTMQFEPSNIQQAAKGHVPVVAFVHGDSLQEGMAFIQTMKANLQYQLESRETQLQSDALPLQEEAQELLEYARSGQATQDEMDIAQRRILEIEDALRALQNVAEQDMFVAEQNMKAVLADAIRRHLEDHAEEEGIDFILNWGLSGEGVLFGAKPWDITNDVLQRINEAHPDPMEARRTDESNESAE